MRSIFRYPGGKTKSTIVNWILAHKPDVVREYREPFVGGGGVFWALPPRLAESRWINDRNEGLIEVYRALLERPDDFIAACKAVDPVGMFEEEMTEPTQEGGARYPKRLKQIFDDVKLSTTCDQAFRYFYVNRTVFGGRVNYDIPSRLFFSNPDGWNIVSSGRLEEAAHHIAGSLVTCGDYEALLSSPGEDVWIYADPPYVVNGNLSPTSQLYQHGFDDACHRRFAQAVRQSPHKVAVSYDDCELVHELFPESEGFYYVRATWRYCGTTNEEKATGKELLILNYPPPKICVPVPTVDEEDPAELSDDEQGSLEQLESKIAASLKSFLDIAAALQQIRERKLYRNQHGRTFEKYCKERWDMGRSMANKLIAAAEVVKNLGTIVPILPANESQARQLTRLESPQKAEEVWERVTYRSEFEQRPITAKLVKEEVDKALGVEPPAKKSDVLKIQELWDKLSPDDMVLVKEWINGRFVRCQPGEDVSRLVEDHECEAPDESRGHDLRVHRGVG